MVPPRPTAPRPLIHLRERHRGRSSVTSGPSPDTPTPAPADERGRRRSARTFLVDVIVRSGGSERRAVASGRDIYAVTAPLAVGGRPEYGRKAPRSLRADR
jgi:hypothetical protein